jgi:hypothetical protein
MSSDDVGVGGGVGPARGIHIGGPPPGLGFGMGPINILALGRWVTRESLHFCLRVVLKTEHDEIQPFMLRKGIHCPTEAIQGIVLRHATMR